MNTDIRYIRNGANAPFSRKTVVYLSLHRGEAAPLVQTSRERCKPLLLSTDIDTTSESLNGDCQAIGALRGPLCVGGRAVQAFGFDCRRLEPRKGTTVYLENTDVYREQ